MKFCIFEVKIKRIIISVRVGIGVWERGNKNLIKSPDNSGYSDSIGIKYALTVKKRKIF